MTGILLNLPLARVNRTLGTLFVLLTLAGLASEILLNVYADEWGYGLVPLMNLSYEGNVPTWYSSTLLFACAVLLALIAKAKFSEGAAYRPHWAVMAIIFLYLSIDESAVIHELINPALTDTYGLGGIFFFSWVIPFGILVVVFVLAYLGFLRHLTPRFRAWFVLAGAIYVGGALGTELPVSFWYERHGGDNLVYGLLNLAQESLEILGASIFCAALFAYIQTSMGELRIAVTAGPPEG